MFLDYQPKQHPEARYFVQYQKAPLGAVEWLLLLPQSKKKTGLVALRGRILTTRPSRSCLNFLEFQPSEHPEARYFVQYQRAPLGVVHWLPLLSHSKKINKMVQQPCRDTTIKTFCCLAFCFEIQSDYPFLSEPAPEDESFFWKEH